MKHNLDHALRSALNWERALLASTARRSVVFFCAAWGSTHGGVFIMASSAPHQHLVSPLQSHGPDPKPLTDAPSNAPAGSSESALVPSKKSVISKQHSPLPPSNSILCPSDQHSLPPPQAEVVTVTPSGGELEHSPAAAKAGDDTVESDGRVPVAADRADAQTLPGGQMKSLGQADMIQDIIEGERELLFKREFPEATFNPSPCWEVEQFFKSSLDLQLNHLARYPERTQFLLRTVHRKLG